MSAKTAKADEKPKAKSPARNQNKNTEPAVPPELTEEEQVKPTDEASAKAGKRSVKAIKEAEEKQPRKPAKPLTLKSLTHRRKLRSKPPAPA